MNVLDVKKSTAPMTDGTLDAMLSSRREVYRGFAAIEDQRGGLPIEISLTTSRGQEVARSLIMRSIEELTEALDAKARVHMLEELIDAINYLWTLLIVDPNSMPGVPLESCLWHLLYGQVRWGSDYLSELAIGRYCMLAAPLLSRFRNRPWQNSPQSLYFDGKAELENFVITGSVLIMSLFKSWDEFYSLWIAKDEVLRFRLRSNY